MNSKFLSYLDQVERGELDSTHFIIENYPFLEKEIKWDEDLIEQLHNGEKRESKIHLHFLGWINRDGLGVPQNYVKAKEYYECSGIPSSLINLGNFYYMGVGVTQDYQLSLYYTIESGIIFRITTMLNGSLENIQLSILQNGINPKLALSLSKIEDFSPYKLEQKILIPVRMMAQMAKQEMEIKKKEKEIRYLKDEYWAPPSKNNPQGGPGFQQCQSRFSGGKYTRE